MDCASYLAWATGEIVTAAQMNEQIRDNELYIKGIIDTAIQRAGTVAFTADQPMGTKKLTGLGAGSAAGNSVRYEQLQEITAVDVSASRAFDTNYQNTSGKIIWVAVTVQATTTGVDGEVFIDARIGAASPPTLTTSEGWGHQSSNATAIRASVFFLVPDDYYYKVAITNTGSGTNQITTWCEGELH